MKLLLILSTLLAVAWASHSCTKDMIATYIQNNLSAACSESLKDLAPLRSREDGQPLRSISPSSISAVCQSGCGGLYSNWLNATCGNSPEARIVQATCLYTSDSTDAGPRCRHVFPDATKIRPLFVNFYTKCVRNAALFQPEGCPEGCRSVLEAIVGHLGCCYQSLYNDTTFVTGFRNAGFINDTIKTGILNIGRLAVWEECNVSGPARCEDLRATVSGEHSSHCFVSYTLIWLVAAIPTLLLY